MSLLALDIASKCGWCVVKDGGQMYSGVEKKLSKPKDREVDRLIRFREMLNKLHEEFGITRIAWEQVAFSRFTRAHAVHNQMLAILLLWSHDNEIEDMCSVAVGTLKKWATGSGKAKKDEMIAASIARWPGFIPETDDEADARFIAQWAIEEGFK